MDRSGILRVADRVRTRAGALRGSNWRLARREGPIHAGIVRFASAVRAARLVPAAVLLSHGSGVPRPGGAPSLAGGRVHGDADVDRAPPPDAPRRHARLHGERPDALSAPSSRRTSRTCAVSSCRSAISPTASKRTTAGATWARSHRRVSDLDFNRAFHPFCLFNSAYDCRIRPRAG